MEPSLDPMEHWFRYLGQHIAVVPSEQETGQTCHSCGSTRRPTVRLGTKVGGVAPSVCVCCYSIRIRYPSAKGTMARLGAGTFALVSPSRTVMWTGYRVRGVPVEPIAGRFGEVIRDLVLNPPEPPFLFVALGRRNFGSTFQINTGRDMIWVSGGGLKLAGQNIERFDRVSVAAFLSRFGELKRDWVRSFAYASLDRYNGVSDTFDKMVAKEPRSRDILRHLPTIGTTEYSVLTSLLQ